MKILKFPKTGDEDTYSYAISIYAFNQIYES